MRRTAQLSLLSLSRFCHGLAHIFQHWLLWAIAVSVISPISPHVSVTLGQSFGDCVYIGTRGYQYRSFERRCPLIAIIDTRKAADS
ncbi:MAG: hypothetical protein ACFB2Z_09160 [Maricaulaceae bacterium]